MNTTTNTATIIEQVQQLTNEALCKHVRHLSDNNDYFARHRDTSPLAVEYAERLYLAIEEQKRRFASLPGIAYATVYVETSFKYVTLTDATWEAYESGSYADGRNGALVGINAKTGKVERFDWAHLSKAHKRYPDDAVQFNLATCG